MQNKIPRNDFGNIDLYVPHMLPAGGVHITSKFSILILSLLSRLLNVNDERRWTGKYAAKCAKTLEIPYAEAVVCHLALSSSLLRIDGCSGGI